MMAEWSKVPLTASGLSLEFLASACEKVASDLGLGNGFTGYSSFLYHLQLASHDLV